MFKPQAKFGKLSTKGGNTCQNQRKPAQKHTCMFNESVLTDRDAQIEDKTRGDKKFK